MAKYSKVGTNNFNFYYSSKEVEYINSIMAFPQASAPTGWTKQTTYNDTTIRIVSGVPSSGGSLSASSTFTNKTIYSAVGPFPVTVGPHTITTAEMATHNHTLSPGVLNYSATTIPRAATSLIRATAGATAPQASPALASGQPSVAAGTAHTHTGTSAVNFNSPFNFAIKYMDVILAKYT